MWRALSENLPTKVNLRSKRVEIEVWCPACQSDAESVIHTLVFCPFAVECWNTSGITAVRGEFQRFSDWFQGLVKIASREEIHRAAVLCWMIWKNRNDLVWNQRSIGVTEVVESAKSILDQWKSVQDKSFDIFLGFMTRDDGHEHWCVPRQTKSR